MNWFGKTLPISARVLNLRPILMAAFAFIPGVVPLHAAHGAGPAAQSTGTAVLGGMLIARLRWAWS